MSSPPSKKLKTSFLTDPNQSKEKKLINNLNHSDGAKTNGEMSEIDEGLYSRQLYVLGADSMRRMAAADILISGLDGLGVETAKNVILAGVRSVTLHDPNPISWSDLSSHFFATPDDVGRGRVETCVNKLSELNSYVSLNTITSTKLSREDLTKFTTVVLCQANHDQCIEIGSICHELGVKFVAANTCGVFGRVFCDFGSEFTVVDSNGEDPPLVMIQHIEQSKRGLVTCFEGAYHGFEDGDYVTFTEVKGMTELNDCKPRKISVVGPHAFSIGDTSNMNSYISGGICTSVKTPKYLSFKPIRDAFLEPEFLITDYTKMSHPSQLHLYFKALSDYKKKHGILPASWNETDAKCFFECLQSVKEEVVNTGAAVSELDERLSSLFSFTCGGQCSPINSVIGGFSAQEALKSCTGKFMPLKQWLYLDAVECLPFSVRKGDIVIAKEDDIPQSNRYSGQIAIFGQDFQDRLASKKYFIVGCGALGCEILKSFATMGVGAGADGKITVTDMDTIERSNLNRQFLFRPSDVGKTKSGVAAAAVKKFNPEINIDAHDNQIGRESENVYHDGFYQHLDGVINALDNIESRKYVDRRCVFLRKPLLESGTLGTKGNVQVIIPYLTESYSSSEDPPEKSYPTCTVKNFPYFIEHAIQWARDQFEGLFVDTSQNMAAFLKDREGFIERIKKTSGNQSIEILETLRTNLIDKRPKTIADCVTWARLLWQDNFSNPIKQLLFNFPPDHTTSTGVEFWSAPKRCPHPLEFDVRNKTHMDYVLYAANIYAFIFNIPACHDLSELAALLQDVAVPPFKPRTGVRIDITEAEAQEHSSAQQSDNARLADLVRTLMDFNPTDEEGVNVVEFEKDDDSNFHIDFITAASNLRAECYNIPTADRFKTKFIAGKIIPAIATMTSLIVGLVCLELYKLVQGCRDRTQYKNAFVDLATPSFTFYEPVSPATSTYCDNVFTIWERFDLHRPLTLKQLLDHFKEKYGLTVTMVSHEVLMIFAPFLSESKRTERLAMPLEEVVRTVGNRPILPHVRALVFDLCCNDEDGEYVDVPYVCYHLQN